jgi:hypothetical protein
MQTICTPKSITINNGQITDICLNKEYAQMLAEDGELINTFADWEREIGDCRINDLQVNRKFWQLSRALKREVYKFCKANRLTVGE